MKQENRTKADFNDVTFNKYSFDAQILEIRACILALDRNRIDHYHHHCNERKTFDFDENYSSLGRVLIKICYHFGQIMLFSQV